MTSLQLPPPRKNPVAPSIQASTQNVSSATTSQALTTNATAAKSTSDKVQVAPSYEERCRAAAEASKLTPEERKSRPKLFVPRKLADFDDGGSFPEIHVAQYPRNMGNPHLKRKKAAGAPGSQSSQQVGVGQSRALVNVEVDKDGEVSYDAIVKGGTNSDKIVYSRLEDMKGGKPNEDDIALPTEEEEKAEAARTQAALSALLSKKTALDKPSGSAMINAATSQNQEEKTQFIKYTPRPDAPGYNPAAAQRVIQMVPAQVDPFMPPKHKHVKAPRGPAEDPVPVLHAPPRKLTKEEKEQWNIPACISNWKNTRGYTIPLDKRLAADGRGLKDNSINSDKFASLSESLYVAEKQARQEVRMRATVQKKLAMQEKERREEELRKLANQARLERAGAGPSESIDPIPKEDDDDGSDASSFASSDYGNGRKHAPGKETEDDVAAKQREKLRIERKRERERELRLEKNMEAKKKQRLEEERDVSEKIALGVHTGTGGGGEVDSRLYNQTAGMDSGFGADDEYNAYSKPLFGDRQGATSSSIYRPTRGETEYNADEQYDRLVEGATSKFQPDKGFGGAEGGKNLSAGPRTAPVQFEKEQKS